MRILLDENLDHRLRNHLSPHQVFTTNYKGWNGLKNGKLLAAAEDDHLDILITGDQTLHAEQNLGGLRLAIIVLSSVEWRLLSRYLPLIMAAVERATPGSLQFVDCGRFARKPLP